LYQGCSSVPLPDLSVLDGYNCRESDSSIMEVLKPTKTVYTGSQFLDWQRSGVLHLNPIFQRRPVWKRPARSQLIDSIYRGFPIPIILLRQVQDLNTLKNRMEVVDGQQRLRTLISFLDSSAIKDFDPAKDEVVVSRSHNKEIAGKGFNKLAAEDKRAILDYEFSTHVLPASTGDELVFRIFARLNSTGLSLNEQEIRNAEWHGAFKSLVYDLGLQYLDYWRRWKVFGNDDIARMAEAEAVSEYLMAMVNGLTGKAQSRITRFYKDNDDEIPAGGILRDRFIKMMESIESGLGSEIAQSAFRRPALFFSLFVSLYDHVYGLGSRLKKRAPAKLPKNLATAFRRVSDRIRDKRLPEDVQDAMDKATSDPERRRIRHKFLLRELGLKGARD
jgi:hypothetical protein